MVQRALDGWRKKRDVKAIFNDYLVGNKAPKTASASLVCGVVKPKQPHASGVQVSHTVCVDLVPKIQTAASIWLINDMDVFN